MIGGNINGFKICKPSKIFYFYPLFFKQSKNKSVHMLIYLWYTFLRG